MTNIAVDQRHLWGGSSESAVLLGVSPFGTRFELYHRKKGSLPPLEDTERMAAGRFFEPAIAAWAAHVWDWPLNKVSQYLTHPTLPRIGASLDYETQEGSEPVEIKNVDGFQFKKEWAAEGDFITDAPLYYLIQVQHQLMCRPEAPHGWLVACVGGNSLKRMKIQRHAGTIELIERAWAQFWDDIDASREPKPDFEQDAATVAALYSAAGEDVADMRNHNRLPELCAEYCSAGAAEKAAKSRKDAAKAEMLTIIGEAKKALVNGFSISAGTINRKPYTVEAASYRDFRIFEKKEA